MNKHYHVSLVDDDDYENPVFKFDFKTPERATSQHEMLVGLAEAADNDELSVLNEVCFGSYCTNFVEDREAPKATFKRVPGSMGYDYVVNGTSCTCPDATFRNHTCKHQQYFKQGLYVHYQDVDQAVFDSAKADTLKYR